MISHLSGFISLSILLQVIVPATVRLYSHLEIEAERLGQINGHDNNGEIQKFDFIIVGAGSAGAVIANRLSSSKKFRVLLIERGGEPNPFQAVPLISVSLLNNPDVDYRYHTTPQKTSCLSLNGRSSLWSRGKGIGGSSNLNLQVYIRGHPKDYSNWVNITGDKRWSYENVLPFFKKSENYCVSCEPKQRDPTFNSKYHNTNGLLSVAKPTQLPLIEKFLQAIEWFGVPRTDLNGPYIQGCAPMTMTQKKGRRSSTGSAFIDPIRNLRTLTIQKFARVYKIMLKKNDALRAYGIRYEKFGLKYTAHATKEIIISAGTIESPKLLMLSGIGPKEHLQSFGIPVLQNLPVGQNLQDHISALVGPFTIDKPISPIIERDLTFASIREFIQNGTGILTATSVMATACISSQIGKDQGTGDWPDLQLILVGLGVSRLTSDQFAESMNVDQKKMREFLDPLGGRDGFILYVSLARPASRGEILLQSSDYRIDPLINPKYFEDKGMKDIKILLEGVKTAVNISENAPSFAKLGARLSSIPWPSCSHHPFRSDEYWECQIRHVSLTVWHYVGTAAMGRENSPNAVVTSELRVIGTENLRVIDASVMPDVVSINTNAPTIMIAERGSQFILDTYAKDLK